jgi:hypothetical protein
MTESHVEYVNDIVSYVYENPRSKLLEICNEELLLAIIHREKSL